MDLNTDLKNVAKVGALSTKIDNLDIDLINSISDEIYQRQPFVMSIILGYRFDVTLQELDEIIKMYFLIWEYFKDKKRVQTKKVTESEFEEIQQRHIDMLFYTEGESDEQVIQQIYHNDFARIKSKVLYADIFLRLHSRPALEKMDEQKRGLLLIGLKSIIECFEKN